MSSDSGIASIIPMVEIEENPVTANVEGDFVVFLIGMRINPTFRTLNCHIVRLATALLGIDSFHEEV